ncbi:MAG: HIT domain-containing protein [Chloroflexi bacterium]|nr:HIT domain-containing protein [Chloroflexota bacterium]
MEVKFTPWRFTYIVSPKPADCIFCKAAAQHNDVLNHILHRGKTTFVILNRYPYNNGHLMVVPYRHIADLDTLTTDELSEIAEATRHAVTVLSRTMNPSGFNIGLNLGQVAGAGIADHLHVHVVPRWQGDTNFVGVIADTRLIPQSLEDTWTSLHTQW